MAPRHWLTDSQVGTNMSDRENFVSMRNEKMRFSLGGFAKISVVKMMISRLGVGHISYENEMDTALAQAVTLDLSKSTLFEKSICIKTIF